MARTAKLSKQQLVQAAMACVRQRGSAHLTLDEVAKAAGVSKGAVLHYFPSKTELMRALIANYLETQACIGQPTDSINGHSPAQLLTAWIEEAFRPDNDIRALAVGILSAAANDPSLLAPIQDELGLRQNEIFQNFQDPVAAMVLVLACDGLTLMQALGLKPLNAENTQHVRQKLLEWVSLAMPLEASPTRHLKVVR
jgi:AcrR family transcriptional regulator